MPIILSIILSFNEPAIFITVDYTKNEIFADSKVGGLFNPQIIEGINRGFTSCVEYIIDLMWDRHLWSDQLIERKKIAFFIDYDLWDKEYRIRNIYGETERFVDFDDVLDQVCIQKSIYICPTVILEPKKSYYVLIRVVLKPLIIKDLNNIANYLKGEMKETQKNKGMDLFLHIVRQAKNLTGLEDRAIVGKSASFNP